MYGVARARLPPFAWTPARMQNRVLRPDEVNRWPFFAQSLIARMEDMQSSALDANSNALQAQTSFIGTDSNAGTQDCLICCCPMTPVTVRRLSCCAQNVCKDCYTKLEITRHSMSKEIFTFLKCPYCGQCSGTQIGTCPDGDMSVRVLREDLPGFEGAGTIQILYVVDKGGYTTRRVAYLPYTPEGYRVLMLLRLAWDRRHVFTIGESLTRNQMDVLVWNIHHKTQANGGTYGYPDPTYLTRVTDELKQYGIQ